MTRCWCGRKVSTLPGSNGIECAEHDNPLPARLSPRAGNGTRRAVRRVRSYGWLAGLLLAGVICVAIPLLTRGQFVAWDGIHTIPTGGIR